MKQPRDTGNSLMGKGGITMLLNPPFYTALFFTLVAAMAWWLMIARFHRITNKGLHSETTTYLYEPGDDFAQRLLDYCGAVQ